MRIHAFVIALLLSLASYASSIPFKHLTKLMHHSAIKSNLTQEIRNAGNCKDSNAPICPKPRRPGYVLPPEFLNLSPCSKHRQLNCDGRSGIVNIISKKGTHSGESPCGCSRCLSTAREWSGSPPSRSHNPLIHDVQFLQYHTNVHPPFTPT